MAFQLRAVCRPDGTRADNRLVLGEAAATLRALPPRYDGQVSLVYADPPYNTGTRWSTYNDRKSAKDYTETLSAVFREVPRLLAPHGSLWVSIDDRSIHHVRAILDETFGPACFVATCVWQKRCSRENRGALGDAHEYIVVYAKYRQAFTKYRNLLPPPAKTLAQYCKSDARGRYHTIELTAQSLKGRPNQYYDIIGPDGTVHKPPPGRCWKMVEPKFQALLAAGRISFGAKGTSRPRLIRYLDEVVGVVPWTWWPHEEVGHTQEAKYEQYKLFGRGNGIDTPKPERLIARIVGIASHPGDTVVDPFAGSGTTGAVATKLGRKWVLIDESPKAVALSEDRLRRVVAKTDGVGIPAEAPDCAGFDVYSFTAEGPSVAPTTP
jgi:adenine-specific DNA-methyltransferase